MSEESLSITFTVDATPQRAFDAIRDVRGWWGEGIEGSVDAIGDTFHYRHGDLHDSTQQLITFVPGEKIAWRVTDAHMSFLEHPSEWKGSEIRFELVPRLGQTEVRFTHVGLTEASECYGACRKGWGLYVGESLPRLITTGQGKPDVKERSR
jgi:uncharacterized protein YndB with AHSA1/START domain